MRLCLLLVLSLGLEALASPPKTFRVDYFHTGNATKEEFSLDRLVLEPLPFPGNPKHPLDDTSLGKYLFEVQDPTSGRVLYSRGFSSIYGEWETTPEAAREHRTFHESLRFPAPSAPVRVVLKKRDAKNVFAAVWTLAVNPHDLFVDPSLPESPGALLKLLDSGPSASKVDLLILGDGYTLAERPKFVKDAKRLVEMLFQQPPFKAHRADFNVWGLCPPSLESGISRPSLGVHHRSRVGATYDAFGSERYILTFDNRSFRDVASFAPYEHVEILTNSNTYGGGGIFNLYSTVAADSLWSSYIFVHEFGHHFAALADEYYTSDNAYVPAGARVEPWEKNVTALLDPKNVKWKALQSPGTPLPTPWAKAAFEQESLAVQKVRHQLRAEKRPESEMDALFLKERTAETALLGTDLHAHETGAFEGANYEAKGFFRPQEDCIMFSRDQVPFCAVCQDTISRVIQLYTDG